MQDKQVSLVPADPRLQLQSKKPPVSVFSFVGVPLLNLLYRIVKNSETQEDEAQQLMPIKIALGTLAFYYTALFTFFTHVRFICLLLIRLFSQREDIQGSWFIC